MPSYEQLLKTVQVCQNLSDLEQEIVLFAYNPKLQKFFIVAGRRATIEITIYSDTRMEVNIAKF
jgi:hypothetical protein